MVTWQVLHSLAASGIPFTQLVLGPGCDGESTVEAMRNAVRAADLAGSLLGVMPLDGVVPAMAEMAKTLDANRTPNILARARRFVQASGAGGAGGVGAEDEDPHPAPMDPHLSPPYGDVAGVGAEDEAALCEITRHGHTNSVPWSWLTVTLAIKGGAS